MAKFTEKIVVGAMKLGMKIIGADVSQDEALKALGEVTITDGKGKPIANADLSITVNGQKYDKTTDANGQTTFLVSDLNASTYSDWKVISTETDYYDSVNSSDIVFTIEKQTPSITATAIVTQSFIYPGGVVITLKVLDKFFTSITFIFLSFNFFCKFSFI